MIYAVYVKDEVKGFRLDKRQGFEGKYEYAPGALYSLDHEEPQGLPAELDYVVVDADYEDFLLNNQWQAKTKTFTPIEPVVLKTKQERIDEIAVELGLTLEQKEKLDTLL